MISCEKIGAAFLRERLKQSLSVKDLSVHGNVPEVYINTLEKGGSIELRWLVKMAWGLEVPLNDLLFEAELGEPVGWMRFGKRSPKIKQLVWVVINGAVWPAPQVLQWNDRMQDYAWDGVTGAKKDDLWRTCVVPTLDQRTVAPSPLAVANKEIRRAYEAGEATTFVLANQYGRSYSTIRALLKDSTFGGSRKKSTK